MWPFYQFFIVPVTLVYFVRGKNQSVEVLAPIFLTFFFDEKVSDFFITTRAIPLVECRRPERRMYRVHPFAHSVQPAGQVPPALIPCGRLYCVGQGDPRAVVMWHLAKCHYRTVLPTETTRICNHTVVVGY